MTVYQLLRNISNFPARHKVLTRSEAHIAPSAIVRFRGIEKRPPTRLTIGEHSIVQATIASERPGSIINIGARTFIGASTIACAERIDIGDDVLIAWGCTIVDHDSHPIAWPQRQNDILAYGKGEKDWSNVKIGPVRIADKSWIGFNATILEGVTIGEGAIIGAESVVTKNIPPFTIWGGNPARFIRELTDDER